MRYLIILIFLTSCGGAARHLRLAKKHLKKAEQLGAVVTRDTIYQDKEIIVKEVKVDTVVSSHTDTVEIHKDKLRIRYIKLPADSIYIEGECLPDTIRIKVPVAVEQKIEAKGGIKWWWLLVAMLIGFIIRIGIR